ncbi:hypothetical protein Drorol1_Dr00021006 [Drosera rotundifolia]
MQGLITKTHKLLLNLPKTTPFHPALSNTRRGSSGGEIWENGLVSRVASSPWQKRKWQYNEDWYQRNKRRWWRSWSSSLTTDGVVYGLIAANAAVFFLWRIKDHNFMEKHFTVSLGNFKSGRVHTLITSAFSHVDFFHLASNMVGLYFFGTSIGRTFGPETLLKLYFAGALAGSVFYLVHHSFLAKLLKERRIWDLNPSSVPALGASGAVNAIMLLNIFMFPRATLYINFLIPVPAIFLGMYLIGSDVLRIIEGDLQVSGSAHLGGATVALLAWLRFRQGRF